MKLADIAMGHAARELGTPVPDAEHLGELSSAEAAMLPRISPKIARAEDWLYLALTLAAGCRRRISRMRAASPEYAHEVRNLEQSLESARRHLRTLLAAHHEISPFLQSMLDAEGISL